MWTSQLVYEPRKNLTGLVSDLTHARQVCKAERDYNQSSSRQKRNHHSQHRLNHSQRGVYFSSKTSTSNGDYPIFWTHVYVNHEKYRSLDKVFERRIYNNLVGNLAERANILNFNVDLNLEFSFVFSSSYSNFRVYEDIRNYVISRFVERYEFVLREAKAIFESFIFKCIFALWNSVSICKYG